MSAPTKLADDTELERDSARDGALRAEGSAPTAAPRILAPPQAAVVAGQHSAGNRAVTRHLTGSAGVQRAPNDDDARKTSGMAHAPTLDDSGGVATAPTLPGNAPAPGGPAPTPAGGGAPAGGGPPPAGGGAPGGPAMFGAVAPKLWRQQKAVEATLGDADEAYEDDPKAVIRSPSDDWHHSAWVHQKGPSKEDEDKDPPRVFKVGRQFYVSPDFDGQATELPNIAATGNGGMGQPLTGSAAAGAKPVQQGPSGGAPQPVLKDAYVSGVPVRTQGRTQVAQPISDADVDAAIAANPTKVIRSHNDGWHGDAYRADAGQGTVPKAFKIGDLVVLAPDHPAQGGQRLDGGAGGSTPTGAPSGSAGPGSDLGTVLNPIPIPSDPKAKAEMLRDPVEGPKLRNAINAGNDRDREEHMAKARAGLKEKQDEAKVENPIPKAMSTIAPAPINPELEGDIPHDNKVRADDEASEIETETNTKKWGRSGANAVRTDTTENKVSSGGKTDVKTDTKALSLGAGGASHEWKQRQETTTPDATQVKETSNKATLNLKGLTLAHDTSAEEGKGSSADPADPDSAKRSKVSTHTALNVGPDGMTGTGSAAIENQSGGKAEATGSLKAGPGGLEATGTGSYTTKSGFNGHMSVSGKHNVVAGDPKKLENGTFAVDFTVVDEKGVEVGGGWSKPGGGASMSLSAGTSSASAEFATRVFNTEAEAKMFQLTAALMVSSQLDSIEKAKSVEGALAMKEGESAGSSKTDTTNLGGSASLEGAEIGVAWSDATTRGLTIKRMGGARVQVTPSISEKKQLAASISAWGQFGNTKSETEIDAFAITFEFDLVKDDAKEAFKRYAKLGFPPPMPPAARWVNTTTGHQVADDDVYSFAHIGKIGWDSKAWQQTVVDDKGTHAAAGGGQTEQVELNRIRYLTGDKNRHSDAQITGHLENGKATDFSAQMTVGGEDASFNREQFGRIFRGAKAGPGVDVKTSGEWTLTADIDPKLFEELAQIDPDMRKAKTREEQLKIYSELAKAGGAQMISGQVRASGKKLAWNLELKGDPNFPGAAGREALNAKRAKLQQELKSNRANAGAVAAEAKDVIEGLNKRLAAVSDETKYTDLPDELRNEQKDVVKGHLSEFHSLRNQALSATTQTVENEDLTKTLNRASSGHGYDDVKKEDREVTRLRDLITVHEREISALEKEIAGTFTIVNRMFGGGTSVRWGEGVKANAYKEHNESAKTSLAMARSMDERLKASAQKTREAREKFDAAHEPKDYESTLRALEAALKEQIQILDVELESLREAAREAYIVTSDAAIGRDWKFYEVIKVDGAARSIAISGFTEDD